MVLTRPGLETTVPKISKRLVDASKADTGGNRYYVWDSTLPGFGLLVLPSGVKTYFFRYRNANRKERRITIGKHGSCTPDEALRKAHSLRSLVVKAVIL